MKSKVICFILVLCFVGCKSPNEKMEAKLYDNCMQEANHIKKYFENPKLYCEIYAEMLASKFTDEEAKCFFKDEVGVVDADCRYNAIYVEKKAKYLSRYSSDYRDLMQLVKAKYHKKNK